MAAPRLEVEDQTDAYLADVEGSLDGVTWVKAKRDRQFFVLAPCESGPCRLRYRAKIREGGKAIDELETMSEEGQVVIAPPSGWVLSPPREDDKAIVRLRVKTPPGTSFASGIYRSKTVPEAWDISLADLWTSPYSAFGPLHFRKTTPKGAQVELAFGPDKMGVSDDDVVAWAERCESAIVGYYGQFPMKEALLVFIAGHGRMLGEGKTLGGGGGAIFMRVGETATKKNLERDWVLTHEMVHLTFPTLPRRHHWAEEGIATYVEPWARVRTGWLAVDDAWKGVVEGLPNGQPASGDQGIDNTHSWGRTYWGGALFYLLADIGIRKRTNNEKGLEHALRGINAAGGNAAVRWSIADTFAVGDKALGVPVLTELYEAWKDKPVPVDLAKIWKDLGVVYANRKVTFDDSAPDAAIRKAITTPN